MFKTTFSSLMAVTAIIAHVSILFARANKPLDLLLWPLELTVFLRLRDVIRMRFDYKVPSLES